MTKQDFYRGLYDATVGFPRGFLDNEDYDEGYTIGELCNAARNKEMSFSEVPVHAVFAFVGEEKYHYCKRSEESFGAVDDPMDTQDDDVDISDIRCYVCEDQRACRGMLDE
jgi:hypothetical protein